MTTDDEILIDLETFNDAMVQFKESVDGKGLLIFFYFSKSFFLSKFLKNLDFERMPIIFNQLLTYLKHIIESYRLTDSIDILEYAAKLIHLFQGTHI